MVIQLLAAYAFGAAEPTAAQLEAYTKLMEFHFELRFAPDKRSRYIELLKQDAAKGHLVEDIPLAEKSIAQLLKGGQLGVLAWHKEQRRTDDIELSTEQLLNNGTIHGTGLAASVRKEAKSGYLSSKYLLEATKEYGSPIRGDGSIYTSLRRKHIDASYEWTALRLAAVTGHPLWNASPEHRAKIEKSFIAAWDAASSKENVIGWHEQNLMDWLCWRLADFSLLKRMTPYQVKEQLARWGKEVTLVLPEVRPDAEKRTAELKAYVAKMPPAEVQAEYERMVQQDARFARYLEQQQAASRDLKASVDSMRRAMTSWHVANLNIAENIGNTGYQWVLKDR